MDDWVAMICNSHPLLKGVVEIDLRSAIFNASRDFRGSADEREEFMIQRTIDILKENNQLPPEMSAASTEFVNIDDTPEKKVPGETIVIDDTPEGDNASDYAAEAKRTSSKRGPSTAGLGDNPRSRMVSLLSPRPPTEAAPAAAALPTAALPPPALPPPPPSLPPTTLPPAATSTAVASVATSTAVTSTQQVRLMLHCYLLS